MRITATKNTDKSISASEINRSDISEATSIASALKYVLDDMSDRDYSKCLKSCPNLYSELEQFIRSN